MIMERKSSIALLFFFLLIIIGAQDMMVKSEAQRTCEALSGRFSGGCIGNPGNMQCDRVCRRIEGLLSGRCMGLQCYCTRGC